MNLANYRLILIVNGAVIKGMSKNLNGIVLVQFSRYGGPQLL